MKNALSCHPHCTKSQMLALGMATPASTANAVLTNDDTMLPLDTFTCLDGYLDNLATATTTECTTLQSLTDSNVALKANVKTLTASIASLTTAGTILAILHKTGSSPPTAPQQQHQCNQGTSQVIPAPPTTPVRFYYTWLLGAGGSLQWDLHQQSRRAQRCSITDQHHGWQHGEQELRQQVTRRAGKPSTKYYCK